MALFPALLLLVCLQDSDEFGDLLQRRTGTTAVKSPFAPPLQAWPGDQARLSVDAPEMNGRVSISTRGRHVGFSWIFDGGGKGIPTDTVSRYTQEGVEFWPTCAVAVDGRRNLLVGGKRPSDGRAVVERWTFTYAGTAGEHPEIRREVVHVGEEPERLVPRFAVLRVLESGPSLDTVFLHVADPEALMVLDLGSGKLRLAVDLARAPALAERDWASVNACDHATVGLVYAWTVAEPPFGSPTLLLIDEDRDGTIDRTAELDQAFVEEHGWGQECLRFFD